MIRFTIDNQSIEVEDDTTILQAAERLGISIPTLCHLKIHESGGSCMVCAVRNKQNKRLVPSCVGKCKDNPDIDASSEEMLALREQLLQLVLSEHRGECVAPCQLSCPHDMNIPLIMYHVARGERDEARAYAKPCGDCNRRCERGCRRKRIDKSLAIYDIVEGLQAEEKTTSDAKSYAHKLTGFTNEELENLHQIKFYDDDLQNESSRCLACGCFAHTKCQLQALATKMAIKKNSFAPSRREAKRHFFGEICYDLGKCVKCANCVEVGKRLKSDGTGPTLLQRGIRVEIGAPLGVDEASIFRGIERECVEVCPTGALFWHRKQES